MRKVLVLILMLLSLLGFSQNLKTKLQGEWVCTGIFDSSGDTTSGKFGASNEYLRFKFRKGYLSINESPVDNILEFPIKFRMDYFELVFNSNPAPQSGLHLYDKQQVPNIDFQIPESKYFVNFVNNYQIVLSTLSSNKDTIFYNFTKQEYFIDNQPNEKLITDIGYVIIKHLKLSKDSKGANRVEEYFVTNNTENLHPAPLFKDYSESTFGHYVSINFKFPDSYELGTVSEELIIEFDVNKKGVSNISVIKGLSDYFDSSIVKIIEKTKKKWIPVKIDDDVINSRIRVHFIFHLNVVELNLKFSE
jgi:hypothetical protein